MVFQSMLQPMEVCAASGKNFYQQIVKNESKWLYSLQLDNGCYPMTSYKDAVDGRVYMSPYYAEFTALALLESDTKYVKSVKKYLNWQFSHLNTAKQDINGVDGTIYDYWEYVSTNKPSVKKEKVYKENGEKFYDSTDSYAALFLTVLWKYYQVSGDKAYIQKHEKEIGRVVNALNTTIQNDLSIATPSYQVKYLMDNAEVYQGLSDGLLLYQKVFSSNQKIQQQLKKNKSKIRKNIDEKMWHDNKGGYYDSSLVKTGGKYKASKFNWNTFYMDATAQVYVITNGVVSQQSKRAKQVYQNFNKYWSNGKANHQWEKMEYKDEYYWGELVYAAALMKDTKRVKTYMETYQKKVKSSHHEYPLYNGDVAKVIRAAKLMCK